MKKFNSLGETFNYYHYLIGRCDDAFLKYTNACNKLDRKKANMFCRLIKMRVSALAIFLDVPFVMDDEVDSFYYYHRLFLDVKEQFEKNLKCFVELQNVFKPYNFFDNCK